VRGRARNFCQEPWEVNTSPELGIADVSVTCLAHFAQKYFHERILAAHARQSRPACAFRIGQAVTLLDFLVPLKNCFAPRWFFVVLDPKPPLNRHNLSSFYKFQDKERFLNPCPRHVSPRLPPSGETWKYAMRPVTQTNMERFSTYLYSPFCCASLDYYTAEFGNSGGTYELLCIYNSYV
jgi:hypothetical protein